MAIVFFLLVQCNISSTDLNVTSKECAHYRDKSTNIWANYKWFYLLQPCALDIRAIIKVFMAKVTLMFCKAFPLDPEAGPSSVCLICKENPPNPNKLRQSCPPPSQHQRHTVFWTQTPTSINSMCTGLIPNECCDLNRFLPMCLRRRSQIIVHEPSVVGCPYRGEAAALLPLALYCSFSASYLSQCGSVMATTTLQQAIKHGLILSACRRNKTAHD